MQDAICPFNRETADSLTCSVCSSVTLNLSLTSYSKRVILLELLIRCVKEKRGTESETLKLSV